MATIEKRITVKQGTRRSTTLLAAAVALAMFAISSHSASALQPNAPFLASQSKNKGESDQSGSSLELGRRYRTPAHVLIEIKDRIFDEFKKLKR